MEKTGKTIEGLGKVFSHTKQCHILAFKVLVLVFWDGRTLIPVDFSVHKELRNGAIKKKKTILENQICRTARAMDKYNILVGKLKLKKNEIKESKRAYNLNGTKTNLNKTNSLIKAKEKIILRKSKANKVLNSNVKKEHSIKNSLISLKKNYFPCGLTKNEYKKQYSKKRSPKSCGFERKAELKSCKIQSLLKMLKRAVSNGFNPDYVITDTWFFCEELLRKVSDLEGSVKLVSMAKIGLAKYKVLELDKYLNPNQIITLYERKKSKYSSKYKSRYIQIQAMYQGVRVKIFLVKFGSNNRWRLLVTDNFSITFTKIMEVYKIRWSIEVFFKECKQYLLFGSCQSQDFDAQIADFTLSMMRYILISFYERLHYGYTLGGLFREISKQTQKENLVSNIRDSFCEFIEMFSEILGIDIIELYSSLLQNKKAEVLFNLLNIEKTKYA